MMENENKARKMAVAAHGGQKYGDQPYEYHLAQVVAVLERFGFAADAALVAAAWLHDALEDTALTSDEIEAECGAETAELVWRVTDEDGANRRERKAKTYLKTRESEKAIVLKLADRIANVEAGRAGNQGLLKMYRKEQAVFAESLKPFTTTGAALDMWNHLEELLSND
ncbi:MAG: bifunctional (p)ppGpp synthetase/guanosine-3',5'-bis(diphosphate) 3'-pyrophosphohydrolase [Acidobacteria bacterium]|nr:bifunctional (p)ppGpp synthetase/guanosine-3',5'-bis(diphosphate) 3'-pyrophosphohydrolase [Acidobacteriota bacterium]